MIVLRIQIKRFVIKLIIYENFILYIVIVHLRFGTIKLLYSIISKIT